MGKLRKLQEFGWIIGLEVKCKLIMFLIDQENLLIVLKDILKWALEVKREKQRR